MINNWFDFFIYTFFYVGMGLGVGLMGSLYVIVSVLRLDQRFEISWKALLRKERPLGCNPFQDLVLSACVLTGTSYLFFVMGWFYTYFNEVKLFFAQ